MKCLRSVLALACVTLAQCRYKRDDGEYIPCKPDHLTVYKVVVNTFWSADKFPKNYPEWRPPAQWSKLVGRSHDKSFVLFRLGQPASEGLRVFAETGRSDILDAQSQGEGGVYDEFNAPPLSTGEGRTEAEFFVDGNHSRAVQREIGLIRIPTLLSNDEIAVVRRLWAKVLIRDEPSAFLSPLTLHFGLIEATSAKIWERWNLYKVSLISKIVPSPDWFIGIDNFDLCSNGKWLDGITIEVDPIDAGTDSGLTFTSPDWPTVPRGVIYRMTAGYPNHPASSFYYPGLKKLPTLANFQFVKVKEYELSEVFHHSSSHNEVLKMDQISYHYEDESSSKDKELVIIREDFPEKQSKEKPKKAHRTEPTTTTTPRTTTLLTTEATSLWPMITQQSGQSGPRPRIPGSRPSAAGKSLENIPAFIRPNPVLIPYVKDEKTNLKQEKKNAVVQETMLLTTQQPLTSSWFPERESSHLIDIDFEPGLNYPLTNISDDDNAPQKGNIDNIVDRRSDVIQKEIKVKDTKVVIVSQGDTTEAKVDIIDNNVIVPNVTESQRNLKIENGHKKKNQDKKEKSVDLLLKDYKKRTSGKKRKKSRKLPPQNCRVSEWSTWSTCTKTCGIGESTRTRRVTKHAKRGGASCPPLMEAKWCGSERACSRNYFTWD